MFTKARELITGVLGGSSTDRSEAARKAARTRKAEADRRSRTAKRAAQTRKQRDARVEAMVDATRRD